MDEATYYVRRQGRVEGPWTISKLRSEIALRKLGRHHELSEDGNNWKRASEIESLFSTTLGKKRVDHTLPTQSADNASEITTEADELQLELTPIAAQDASAVWYYIVNDVQLGPISSGRLVNAVQEGRIPLDALVWKEGFADWQAVRDTHDIAGRLDDSWRHTQASIAASQSVALPRRSSYAGYALWLGVGCFLISWVPLIGLVGVVPLVLGCLAIRDVRRSEPPFEGMGAGIAGILFGLVSITIAVVEITIIAFVGWNQTQS